MAITNGQPSNAEDFINESESDATPANDAGKVPKLESNGKISEQFLPVVTDNVNFYIFGTASHTVASIFLDRYAKVFGESGGPILWFDIDGQRTQRRTTTSDWADVEAVRSVVLIESYLYVLLEDSSAGVFRLYRYDIDDLTTSSQMTFSGQTFATTSDTVHMTSDGTYFYFTYKAGNSSSDYVVSRYTLSGTTLTYDTDITCGSTANVMNEGILVDSSGNIYGYSGGSNRKITKFNSSGTQQWQGETNTFYNCDGFVNINGSYYIKFANASGTQWSRISLN